MAKPESEIVRIVRNMETMGWPVRIAADGFTYVVQPPAGPTATINCRSGGHGHGRHNLLKTIRDTGYFELWEQYQADHRKDRIAVRQPVIATDKDHTLLVPYQPEAPKIEATTLEDDVTDETAPTTAVGLTGPTDRTQVDGVKIVGRSPAKYDGTGAAVEAGQLVRGVEEILLEDERILYQCVRSVRCFRVFLTVRSATAHLRAHGSAQAAKRADLTYENRSIGARAGWAAQRDRLEQLSDPEVRAGVLTDVSDLLTDVAQVARDLLKLDSKPPLITEEELVRVNALLDANQARIVELEAENARLRIDLDGKHTLSPEELESLTTRAAKWDAFVAARDAK